MALFDDVLLTVDFDRTMTAPDSSVPERNLEAIRFFMENGGSFTINTGRGMATFWKYVDTIPHNVPLLMYNGSAMYENGQLSRLKELDLDVWETMAQMRQMYPDMNLEIQGTRVHYLIDHKPEMVAVYQHMGWRWEPAVWGGDVGPFIKFSLFGRAIKPTVAGMFEATEDEVRYFDQMEQTLKALYGDKVEVFRAAPKIVDVHAKGASKINAARELQAELGKKILVCVGDAPNDLSMLEGADYAFCPADAELADRFETVCDCAKGAVADVIYKKIPEILGIRLDIDE